MFDENDVVERVCLWLEAKGCVVRQRCPSSQKGIDIIAEKDGIAWYVEAKGATSSRLGSARYGRPYTDSQILDRVMKGFYTASELAVMPGRSDACVGLAMPRTKKAEKYILKVIPAMRMLGILMIWVNDDGSITVDN